MADLVTQNDTVRWISAIPSENFTNGDVVEVYWQDGVARCCKVTGTQGRAVGVVENNTNNSLTGLTAGVAGDVQVDGACATVKKLPGSPLASGQIVDYVLHETHCVSSAGYGPKNLMKTSAAALSSATTCAGTLSSQLRRDFNSLLTL